MVPKSLLAVFRLLKFARSSGHDVSIVHCSAGIGRFFSCKMLCVKTFICRTGTFIAIELVLMKILAGSTDGLQQTILEVRG